MEAVFLHSNMEVEMYIEWSEGIVYLGIITKDFLGEYYVLLGKLVYGNVDAALLWLRLLAMYLVNKFNLKSSKADSYISFRKDEKGRIEIVMSVHLEDVFMAVKTETLKNIK